MNHTHKNIPFTVIDSHSPSAGDDRAQVEAHTPQSAPPDDTEQSQAHRHHAPPPVGEPQAQTVIHSHPRMDRNQNLRIIEALIFGADAPVTIDALAEFLPEGCDILGLLQDLQGNYANRGVNLIQVAGAWSFRTADDLSFVLGREVTTQKRLSKAALETLAIVAYHQPVTRADIEEIRGVALSKGTLDVLMEMGWVKLRGRRKAPGRPVTYGTTDDFLIHFGLNNVADLPGLQELKGAGLLEATLPPDFDIPMPRGDDLLAADEEPLDPLEDMPALEMHLPDNLPSSDQ